MSKSPDFGEVAGQFDEYYDGVPGYIREQVTRNNLDFALGLSSTKSKLRIGDVGGGAGRDAAWLASLGHKVVLIEDSQEQIDKAYARKEYTTFDIVHASAEMASRIYSKSPFDLVLSHGVLMYQEDPKEHLRHLNALVKPLGALSLLTAGLNGKKARYAAKQDFANVASLETSGKYVGNLKREVSAYSPEEIEDLLKRTGFNVVNPWFGVRIFSDGDDRNIDSIEKKELETTLAVETELSRIDDVKGIGQMLHFIARKQ